MTIGFETIGKDPQLQDHWIRRLLAFIIDSVIVSLCTLIIAAIISIPFILTALAAGLPWYVLNLFSFPLLVGVLSILYFTLLETYYGSTFGKRIMNLKITTIDGKRPSLYSALIRNVSKIYWILVLLDTIIGLATPGDPHQKITDRIAGTNVAPTAASPLKFVETKLPVNVCSQCGKALPENAVYCPNCGKKRD
ncbi:MAG: RDD family protein [Candidatus Bathyarchaeia archaeon]